MSYKERFTTCRDGNALFRCHWSVDEPRVAFVISHGYGEHSGRYGLLARDLNAAGASVYAYDHRGMGRSAGEAGQIPTYPKHVEDLGEVLADVRALVSCKICLLGHSYGGSVAVRHLATSGSPGIVSALVLSSPAFRLVPNKLLQPFARLLARWYPKFETPGVELDALSRDRAVGEDAAADPLYYDGRIQAETGAQLIAAGREAMAAAGQIHLPLLAFHGTADRIADHKSTRNFVDQYAGTPKSFHALDGFYHETLNEPDRATVVKLIVDFIDSF